MKSFIIATAIVLGLGLAGCSGKGAPLPDGAALKDFAEKARQEAADAQAAGDPKAARRAADRAAAAREKAEKLAAEAKDDAAAQDLAKQVRAVAREAVKFADLAEEEKVLAGKLGSMKARTYRAARAGALKIVFTGLALAAEHAGKAGYDALGPDQKQAADLASQLAGDLKLADGTPDWPAIGATISSLGSRPPPEAACMLAIAFAILQYDGLALLEADLARFPATATPSEQLAEHVIRGFVYRLNGLPRLASRELEAMQAGGGDGAAIADPQFQAAIYLVLACDAIWEKDYRQADGHIARAIKICPNNPAAVLLTGEVQVAEGEYEKAQATLEDSLKQSGVDVDPWYIEKIQARARQIRDSRGEPAEPLICDNRFLCELALHYIGQAAKTSAPVAAVNRWIDSARSFGSDVLKHIPGMAADKEGP